MLKEGKTVAEVYDSANAMADLKKIQNINSLRLSSRSIPFGSRGPIRLGYVTETN